VLLAGSASAQSSPDVDRILQRLDRLEQENRRLMEEVQELRRALGARPGLTSGETSSAPAEVGAMVTGVQPVPGEPIPQAAPVEERVAVQEQKAQDLAQVKVESSQRFPVKLNGMVLFNSFANTRGQQADLDPFIASAGKGNAGGSLRQSQLGFTFEGPRVVGGQMSGSLQLDFFGGTGATYNTLVRLRTATVQVDWKNQTFMVGQDRPLLALRAPTSLAQVGYPALSYAGNLYAWQPQTRFEQRFGFGESTGVRLQGSVFQTNEPTASAGDEYLASLSGSRPALQGRFEVWRKLGANGRVEIAPGFSRSDTHVAEASAPSRIFSIDWLVRPMAKVELTGAYFQGRNAAGIGGLRQGYMINAWDKVIAVRAAGGWAQLGYTLTPRLNFNFYGGQESNKEADLLKGGITRNFVFAGNVIYRIGPNILVGFEASQIRTRFKGVNSLSNNHYDLSLAYQF
jgi:hypothetical protein